VKMAKASKDDIQKVIDFFRFIEEYFEDGTFTTDSEDAEPIKLTEQEFVSRLSALWGGPFKPVGVDCMWQRVVFGCSMLIDNCCDPEADCLELRHDWAKAIDPPEGIEEALEHLRGNKEHFRKVLTDKTKILNSMCAYAERMAKKKRLEPWAIIGDITDHGSGVSSAIYELYRRKLASVEAAS
jgi:hypothetical protein